ncbi:MAG: hypothetical protein DCC68_04750 [Planctomycetota bacterium]|nr:MAG: hypothetical protein DCC68_04750 [Planctomycetota bacterium]
MKPSNRNSVLRSQREINDVAKIAATNASAITRPERLIETVKPTAATNARNATPSTPAMHGPTHEPDQRRRASSVAASAAPPMSTSTLVAYAQS